MSNSFPIFVKKVLYCLHGFYDSSFVRSFSKFQKAKIITMILNKKLFRSQPNIDFMKKHNLKSLDGCFPPSKKSSKRSNENF